MTYEAPPDNDHKVVRLHGTTESLRALGLAPRRTRGASVSGIGGARRHVPGRGMRAVGALAFGLSRLGRRPLFRVALGTSVLARRRRAGHGGRRGGRLPAYRARCDRLRRARLACPRVYGRAMADGARRRTDSRGAPGAGRGRRPRHRGRIAGQRRPRYRRRTRDRSARGRRNPEDGSYQAGWTPTAPGPRDADKGPCRALAAVAAGGARRVRFPKTVFLQWAGRVRVLHGIGAPRGGGFERRCAPKTRPVAANGVSARDRRPRRSRRSHRRGADDGNARCHPGVPHGCDSGFRDRPPARHIGASYRLGGQNPLFQHTRQPRPDSALGASPAHQFASPSRSGLPAAPAQARSPTPFAPAPRFRRSARSS